ncbi:ATP-binding protein [Hazenella sp. IB182353]|uniref:ATP-binding protein n=1 Tax=Polycladospora coralii TaxID=2771432 RepID=UPI001745EA49|nr:ATP-binding protein [Polycladospora coralii]MBS7530848.1 ATP-binding protein [Polycladospora coralii]
MEEIDLSLIGNHLKQARSTLEKKKIECHIHQEQLSELRKRVTKLEMEKELMDKVHAIFDLSAQHAREQAKQQLETLVTNALQYVFGPTFGFVIELKSHSGNPTAEFYVTTTYDEEIIQNKPQDARGGGIVDIISLALRVALIETVRPRPEGPIILDEPGKHISEDYILPMIEFLKSIGETFNRQIIMVTHNTHLTESSDYAYHVRIQDGKSQVQLSRRLDNGIT